MFCSSRARKSPERTRLTNPGPATSAPSMMASNPADRPPGRPRPPPGAGARAPAKPRAPSTWRSACCDGRRPWAPRAGAARRPGPRRRLPWRGDRAPVYRRVRGRRGQPVGPGWARPLACHGVAMVADSPEERIALRFCAVDLDRAATPVLRSVTWQVGAGQRWAVLGPTAGARPPSCSWLGLPSPHPGDGRRPRPAPGPHRCPHPAPAPRDGLGQRRPA